MARPRPLRERIRHYTGGYCDICGCKRDIITDAIRERDADDVCICDQCTSVLHGVIFLPKDSMIFPDEVKDGE